MLVQITGSVHSTRKETPFLTQLAPSKWRDKSAFHSVKTAIHRLILQIYIITKTHY